jgi:hypothetical protein
MVFVQSQRTVVRMTFVGKIGCKYGREERIKLVTSTTSGSSDRHGPRLSKVWQKAKAFEM